MKKTLTFLLLACTAMVPMQADLIFESLEHTGDQSVLTITDEQAGNSVSFTHAQLWFDRTPVNSLSTGCHARNGIATFTVNFPSIAERKKAYKKVLFEIGLNGKTQELDITEDVAGLITINNAPKEAEAESEDEEIAVAPQTAAPASAPRIKVIKEEPKKQLLNPTIVIPESPRRENSTEKEAE